MNSINCDTSWKISLFMDYRDNEECVLKGVCNMTSFAPIYDLVTIFWSKLCRDGN